MTLVACVARADPILRLCSRTAGLSCGQPTLTTSKYSLAQFRFAGTGRGFSSRTSGSRRIVVHSVGFDAQRITTVHQEFGFLPSVGSSSRAFSSAKKSSGKLTDDLSNFKGLDYSKYQVPVEVRWADHDAFAHVNNAIYFTYFENARLRHFGEFGLNLDLSVKGPQPVLKSTGCRYRAMLVAPCDIVVGLCVGEVGETSMIEHYAVYNRDTDRVVAEGEAELVWIDFTTGKRAPIPEIYKQGILACQNGEVLQRPIE